VYCVGVSNGENFIDSDVLVIGMIKECLLVCDSDGRERAVHYKRKQLKAIRRNADVNQHTNLSQPLIPVCQLLF